MKRTAAVSALWVCPLRETCLAFHLQAVLLSLYGPRWLSLAAGQRLCRASDSLRKVKRTRGGTNATAHPISGSRLARIQPTYAQQAKRRTGHYRTLDKEA